MPPKWTEFSASQEFQALPPEAKETARVGFFNQHVAPTISPDRMDDARRYWDSKTLPKPAAPAANVANPDANVAAPTALRRPGAPAPAQGGEGFIEGVKDFGRGLVAGTVQNLPEAAAGLADYADTPTFDAAGKRVGDDGKASQWARETREAAEKRGENWQQSEFGRQMQEKDAFSVRGAAYEAGRNLPLSFGPGLVGAAIGARIAGLPGAAAGYVGGSLIAGLPLFFGHQAKDTYDKVFEATRAANPDLTDEQVHDKAMTAGALTGGVEAGGELVTDLVGTKLFKMLPSGTKQGLIKAATRGFQGAVPMMKGIAKVLATEVGTELGQGAAQAEIEQAYGVGEGATWDNQKGVIMPTILMTLVGGGGAAGMSAHQRYRTAKILQNPNLPPAERANAAQGVARVIAEEDPELAQMFYDSAMGQIQANEPIIAQDDRFYRDLKPLEQREIDKRMAAGYFTDPEPPRESKVANISATETVASEAEPVADNAAPSSPVVDNEPPVQQQQTAAAPNTPPREAPEGMAPRPAAGEATGAPQPQSPGMNRIMRETYMADISAQLKVTREERKAAQAAGNEELVAELDNEIRAIAENFKRVTNGKAPVKTPRQAAQPAEPTAWAGQGTEAAAVPEGPKTVLQNRNRSTPASIDQMTSIAANPDYTRLGFSRDFANGAPVVEPGAEIPPEQMGRQDVATTAAGRQIPVQYAVVEADQLLPSNRADGATVPEYEQGAPGMSRSIAGNGRVAGLQRAFEQGNAAGYVDGVAGDAALHGIPEAAVRALNKPVLVRIMPQEEVTDTIGDESNTSGTAELSPAEQARNDSRRIDVTAVKLDDKGDPSKEAVDQFIASMPTAERAGLLDGKLPNRRAYERLGNAVFAQAYESDELLRLAAESTTPEVRNIMGALKIAAGKLARLKGAGEYDIRGLVIEAAETAINAERNGQTLADYLEQGDMGRNNAVLPILEMMSKNIRSAKQIAGHLAELADVFYNEASLPAADMFGTVEKRGANQLLEQFYGEGTQVQPAQDRPGNQEEAGDTGGADPAARGDEGQAVAPVTGNADESQGETGQAPEQVAPRPKKAKTKTEAKIDDLDAQIDAAAAELAALLKPKPGTLNTGVDPQILLVGTKLGSLYVQKGLVKFAQWAQAIIAKMREMGVEADQIKPHLKEIYAATQQRATDEQFDQMDDARTVRGTDLDNLGAEPATKPTESGTKPPGSGTHPLDKDRYGALMALSNDQLAALLKEGGGSGRASLAKESLIDRIDSLPRKEMLAAYDKVVSQPGESPAPKKESDQNAGPDFTTPDSRTLDGDPEETANTLAVDRSDLEAWRESLARGETPNGDKLATKSAGFQAEYKAEMDLLEESVTGAEAELKRTDPAMYQAYLDEFGGEWKGFDDAGQETGPTDLFGAVPVAQQNLADAKRAKDEKRNGGGKEVPADVDGGIFSNQGQQAGMFDEPVDKEAVDAAAHEAATSPLNDRPQPTEAQKDAGNYKKGHITVHGLDVAIENPRGSTRSGTAPDGTEWSQKMVHHYGYIKRTNGADGDQVDVFVGPDLDSTDVFIVDQVNADGSFDEHKVMIGFNSQWEAEQGYLDNYEDGWELGPVTEMPINAFKKWLASGDTKFPITESDRSVEPDNIMPNKAGEKSAILQDGSRNEEVDNATVDQPGQGTLAGILPEEGGRAGEGGAAGQGSVRGGRGNADGNRADAEGGYDLFGGPGSGDAGVPATGAGTGSAGGPRSGGLNAPTTSHTITDESALGEGGERAKFKDNLAAIRLLKDLEANERQATKEEQAVLAKYVGWGGLKQAFFREDGTTRKGWEDAARELKDLLTEEEYDAARRSVLDAHYTSKEVIDGIYAALDHLGFRQGRILEPGVGVGNFFGLMPPQMRANSELTGVELDHITGGIAKQLYPHAKINSPMGFQEFPITEGYFDAAVGNPPFGSQKLHDRSNRDIAGFSIHNYFFAKSINGLRPGGVLAMVVSNGLMDKISPKQREYMASKAKLLGAVRLPNNAFKKNANTEVTTDIIFLQRLAEGEKPADTSWTETQDITGADGSTIRLNNYFAANPDMMLGEMRSEGTMYRAGQAALIAKPDQNTGQLLKEAIKKLPAGVYSPENARPAKPAAPAAPISGVKSVAVGSFFFDGDNLKVRLKDINGEPQSESVTHRTNSAGAEVPLKPAEIKRIKGMVDIAKPLSLLLRKQIDPESTDAELAMLRSGLNKAYDAFLKKFGFLNARVNTGLMVSDPVWPKLAALEHNYDSGISKLVARKEGVAPRDPSAKKADIFTKRTQSPYVPVASVSSAEEALSVTLSEVGTVDMPYMERLYGKSEDAIAKELGGLIFADPVGGWATRDEYLSGNVKMKLAQAEAAAKEDDRYTPNITALKAVLPQDIEAADIKVKIGAPWIPPEVLGEFIDHLAGGRTGAKFNYAAPIARWSGNASHFPPDLVHKWGTGVMDGFELVLLAANNKIPRITAKDRDGKVYTDVEATEAAQQKQNEIKQEFEDWLWDNADRRERLAKIYNESYNTNVARRYDGSHLQMPGKVADDIITLRPHQKNFVWRVMQSQTTLADHVVGAGKTMALIGSIMELRRTGMVKKPMLVVPNHLVQQWATEFQELYPNANILVPDKKDFAKLRRKIMFGRIATGDWDAVIVAHSSFAKLPSDAVEQEKFIKEQIRDLEESRAMLAAAEGEKSRSVRDMEKMKDTLVEKLRALTDIAHQDEDGFSFTELGVDGLFVDEAHGFKNLEFQTSMGRMPGINPAGSAKAADMFVKVRSVLGRNGRVVYATGTPISNSMVEMYTMQRYLGYQALKDQGLSHFDAWANVYGEVVTDFELDSTGVNYKLNSRFNKFVNMPELMQQFGAFADTVTRDDINDMLKANGGRLPVPNLRTGGPINVVAPRSDAVAAYMEEIVQRATNMPKDPRIDNMLKVTGDARKAALDMRLIDPSASFDTEGKVAVALANVLDEYKKSSKVKGTQLIFCDLSTPKGAVGRERARIEALVRAADEGDEAAREKLDNMSPDELDALNSSFSVYDDVKAQLIEAGIPANEIAFIHDANTDLQKQALFAKVNRGEVRVLMGSTEKMGAGMNAQKRLVALHHLDAPWRPSDLEQREGRIIRQGNELYAADPENFEVSIYRYATEQTYDSRMWQTIEGKARFIEQVRTGTMEGREMEDIAGASASAAEMKAAASGNPLILEEFKLRAEIRKLSGLERSHSRKQWGIEDAIRANERVIGTAPQTIADIKKDVALREKNTPVGEDGKPVFAATIEGVEYDKREDAGKKFILEVARFLKSGKQDQSGIGTLRGFKINFYRRSPSVVGVELEGAAREYHVDEYQADKISAAGIMTRLGNVIAGIDKEILELEARVERAEREIPALREQAGAPFKDKARLDAARKEHAEILKKLTPKDEVPSYTGQADAVIGQGTIDPATGKFSGSGNWYVVAPGLFFYKNSPRDGFKTREQLEAWMAEQKSSHQSRAPSQAQAANMNTATGPASRPAPARPANLAGASLGQVVYNPEPTRAPSPPREPAPANDAEIQAWKNEVLGLVGRLRERGDQRTADIYARKTNSELPRTKAERDQTLTWLKDKVSKLEGTAAPAYATAPEPQGMETWQARHTQTGEALFMAKPTAKLGRDAYNSVAKLARDNGGHWSRFGKAGFLFKSEEARKAFLDAVGYTGGVSDVGAGYDRAASNVQGGRRYPGISEPGPDAGRGQIDLFSADASPAEKRETLKKNFATTTRHQQVGEFKTGLDVIKSAEDLAHLVAPLRKNAQEQFIVAATDAAGKVLMVGRHTVGLRDSSQVDPLTVVAQVAGVPGATTIHYAHNHPSGANEASNADQTITRKLNGFLDGTGIEFGHHVIVAATGKAAWLDGSDSSAIRIVPQRRNKSIPIVERMMQKRGKLGAAITSPHELKRFVSWLPEGNHVVLLNTQHTPVGTIELTTEQMTALRDEGRAREILAGFDTVNAGTAIISVTGDGEDAMGAAKNLARMLNSKDVRLLDVAFRAPNSKQRDYTDSENGGRLTDERGGWFRAGSTKSGKVAVADVQAIVEKIGGKWGSRVTVVQNSAGLPESAQYELRRQGITSEVTGYFDRQTKAIYLVADAMRDKYEAQVTLLHEAVGHLGIETVMGKEINQFLRSVYEARNTDPAIRKAWEYVNRPETYGDAPQVVQAAEIVARIAESDPKHTLVQRFMQMARQWLRKLGFNVPFSNNDIIEALRRAKRALQDGSYAGEGSEGGLFQAAWHGSPARHNKFSTDYIGTGEGAQAYGYGLYFAQKREIAEYYRDGLAEKPQYVLGRRLVEQFPGISAPALKEIAANYIVDGKSAEQSIRLASYAFAKDREAIAAASPEIEKALQSAAKSSGALYAVEVPENDELLNWDAPLNEQPPAVRESITSVLDNIVNSETDYHKASDYSRKFEAMDQSAITGEELYKELSSILHSDKAASLALKAAGIPGLRYFDEQSRNQAPPVPEFTAWAGYFKGANLKTISDRDLADLRDEYQEFVDAEDNRTRNFVIFDDSRVDITESLFRVAGDELTENDLYAFEAEIIEKYGLDSFFLMLSRDQETITLANFVVPKDKQKQGVGSAAMQELTDFADSYGKTLYLDPAQPDDRKGTTSRARLVRFYKRFGFVENKGRNKDFTYYGGMYRRPATKGGLFRARDPEEVAQRPLRATIRDRLDAVRFEIQDKLIDLKRIQEEADPADEANAYQKAAIWEGKAGERINDFDEDSVQPLLAAISRTGMEWDEVGRWLVARHAKEANAYLAEINPDMGEDERRYRLSGMSNEQAAEILARNDTNAHLWEVGDLVDRINRERVEMLVDEGLITPDMAASWQGRYQHYVPLKREEAEGADFLPARGQGFNIKGRESKMRTGSADWTPGKIVANVIAQAEASIVRSEKNKVGLALLKFVEQHPDPSFWNIDTERTMKYVRDGKVVEGVKPQDDIHELSVKRNGVQHYISFNTSNPRAMRLVTGLKNLQAADMGSVMRALATVTRFLATINTSWNPEFMVSNFARDIQTAAYNLSSTDIADMRGRVMKDVPAAMKGIRSALFGDGSAEWAQVWDDFRRQGGKTGWIDIHGDIKKQEQNLQKMAERLASGKPSRGAFERLGKYVENMNNVIENSVRLAAYKNALDAGLTKDRAAALAKDLTVNFNRKGNRGAVINALYMFFNASVQGNVRLIQTIANSKQGRRLAYATVGFAIALDLINRSMSGDDDDGENIYDSLPDYLKDRNIIIMGEKEPILKIPAPWGYNVLHTFGQVIGKTMWQAWSGERFTPLDSASRVAMGIVDAFNPMGSGTVAQILSPTITDPIVQIAENKTFTGAPLKPEHTFDTRAPQPEYLMHWSSSRQASNAIAKFLNDASGGNEIRPGQINISPEWIDLIVDTVTGGAGMTVANTLDLATRLASGDEIPVENTPFLRKVYGFNSEKGLKGRYYEWSRGVAYAQAEAKGLRGEELAEARRNPEFAMIGLYKATEKQLRGMRKMRREMVERGASEDKIEKLDARMRAVMARFNEAYARKVLNQ